MKFYKVTFDLEKIERINNSIVEHLGELRYIGHNAIYIYKRNHKEGAAIFQASGAFKAMRKMASIFIQGCNLHTEHNRHINPDAKVITIDDVILLGGMTAELVDVKPNLHLQDKDNFNYGAIKPNYDSISYITIK